MRLRHLQVRHFKAFSRFDLHLGPNAFLVGPNNAGKSTLIAAVRSSAELLRHASKRKTTGFRRHENLPVRSHEMSKVLRGLVTENLRHQFDTAETTFMLRTDTDVKLTAVWPRDLEEGDSPYFYLQHEDGRHITQPAVLRPLVGQIGIIPGLAPLNQSERLLDHDYVDDHYEHRRTSQHARNHLAMLKDDEWELQRQFILDWLPELEDIEVRIHPPDIQGHRLTDIYIREVGDRVPKELFWAGDGMQVFIQLLTHLHRHRDADVIVLDEPDLYLHADMQRRLVRLLDSLTAQTITATHSPEMLSEAPADAVVWVDKSRRHGIKRPSPATLEDLSAQIGSMFILRLASALRARTVVFVEGKDMSILRRLAITAGANAVAEERGCAVIPMEGFSHWVHVEPFKWLLDKFLDKSVDVFVLLDRDYRSDVESLDIENQLSGAGVQPHVWRRKELESYLLAPTAIARLSGLPTVETISLLARITNEMRPDVETSFAARWVHAPSASTSDDALSLLLEDDDFRLRRFPAKRIFNILNRSLKEMGLESVSQHRLARNLRTHELDPEMTTWLTDVESSLTRRSALHR